MRRNALQAGFMTDEQQAFDQLIAMRWPKGPVCPFCKHTKVYRMIRKGRTRPGQKAEAPLRRLLKCAECRKQFSPSVGTIFEDSHLPLTTWMNAIYLICSSKKGISTHQLHRTLGITYRTAWFLSHRIRYAMKALHIGKLDGIVEMDETYIGSRHRQLKSGSRAHKIPVVSLVQRQGTVRSMVLPTVNSINLRGILREHCEPTTQLMTDQSTMYARVKEEFPLHETVNHRSKEWVRGQAHTNTIEGYFSLLKRGLAGTFHHVSKEHLHRYLAEFDFRYNGRKLSDMDRYLVALKATEGKRLTYQSAR